MQHVNTLASLPKEALAVVIGRPIGILHLPSSNGEWHGLTLSEDDIAFGPGARCNFSCSGNPPAFSGPDCI